jgi:hypothetical protein
VGFDKRRANAAWAGVDAVRSVLCAARLKGRTSGFACAYEPNLCEGLAHDFGCQGRSKVLDTLNNFFLGEVSYKSYSGEGKKQSSLRTASEQIWLRNISIC